MKIADIKNVIILSGLTDYHINIGQSGRYDLVAFPWERGAFTKSVKAIILSDFEQYAQIQYPLFNEEKTLYDKQLLKRGTGIQAWIKPTKYCPDILALILRGYGRNRFNRAAKFLDHLSYHVPADIVFPWLVECDEADTIKLFEMELLQYFENVSQ